jgi:hypothetical protein
MMRRYHATPAALVMLVSLAALQSVAAAPARSGPFAKMAGSWSGAGHIVMANGMQERLRCRANYDVGGGGSEMRLSIRCASAGYNFDLGGEVESDGRVISGSWSEATRNANGTVSGRVSGDRIEVVARGGAFTASLSLVTRDNQQAVTIAPQGTEVSAVSITLAKGSPSTTGAAR